METEANAVWINQSGDNTPIRVLGEVENIGDDKIPHFAQALGMLVSRIFPPDRRLSGQAQPYPLEFGVALGSVLSVERTPAYFAVFNDPDHPPTVDVFQLHVVWFSGNHVRNPFHLMTRTINGAPLHRAVAIRSGIWVTMIHALFCMFAGERRARGGQPSRVSGSTPTGASLIRAKPPAL
ncbi:hypothetical protein [Mesorhizobium sp. M4B.F.Ca.ET.049.02.1.2]|uniref:hypothetical protein n=1 Tax=Mesorhizobium sp. M4B.F.Ca.ET.049.02.1.2 TaxID=2496752 RepID=UPI00167454D2|nr:hypothetical protein [Mesorhizobium sp. M4B.F.Ca.ET.049.02.1.2]